MLGAGLHDVSSGGTFDGKLDLAIRTTAGNLPGGLGRLSSFGEDTPGAGVDANIVNVAHGPANGARVEFVVQDSSDAGTYRLDVSGEGSASGTYTLRVVDIATEAGFRDPYIPNSPGDFTSDFVGGRAAGLYTTRSNAPGIGPIEIEDDTDWNPVQLAASTCCRIEVTSVQYSLAIFCAPPVLGDNEA